MPRTAAAALLLVVAAAAATCSDLRCGERRRLVCAVTAERRTSRDNRADNKQRSGAAMCAAAAIRTHTNTLQYEVNAARGQSNPRERRKTCSCSGFLYIFAD